MFVPSRPYIFKSLNRERGFRLPSPRFSSRVACFPRWLFGGGGASFNAPLKGCSWKSEQELFFFLTTSQSPRAQTWSCLWPPHAKEEASPTPPTSDVACQSSKPVHMWWLSDFFFFFVTTRIFDWSWEHILITAEDMIDSNHTWDPAEALMASRRNGEEEGGGLRGNLFEGGVLREGSV